MNSLFRIGEILVCVAFALPCLAIIVSALTVAPTTSWGWVPWWMGNTAILLASVTFCSLILAYPTAWLMSYFSFPLARVLGVALILPLAAPSWISSFVFLDIFDDSGVVQLWLRQTLPVAPIEVRNPVVAGFVLALHLYPYLYLTLRVALARQQELVFRAGQALGRTPRWLFFRFGLPAVRPALVVGLTLVVLESLNDFGTATAFSVQTMTTGIYASWLTFGDSGTATRLGLLMLVLVGGVLWMERRARGGQEYQYRAGVVLQATRLPLQGLAAYAAMAICAIPVLLGFVFPLVAILFYAGLGADTVQLFTADVGRAAWNSFRLGIVAAGICLVVAGVLAAQIRAGRTFRFPLKYDAAERLIPLTYAMPGIVLAFALLTLSGIVDRFLYDAFSATFVLSGSVGLLLMAYVLRFSAVAFGQLNHALVVLPNTLDHAAAALGHGRWMIWRRVHFPLLTPAVRVALFLVALESIKELPATLVLVPFDFATLTTLSFQLLSDERFAEAAFPSVLVIALGGISLVLATRFRN